MHVPLYDLLILGHWRIEDSLPVIMPDMASHLRSLDVPCNVSVGVSRITSSRRRGGERHIGKMSFPYLIVSYVLSYRGFRPRDLKFGR